MPKQEENNGKNVKIWPPPRARPFLSFTIGIVGLQAALFPLSSPFLLIYFGSFGGVRSSLFLHCVFVAGQQFQVKNALDSLRLRFTHLVKMLFLANLAKAYLKRERNSAALRPTSFLYTILTMFFPASGLLRLISLVLIIPIIVFHGMYHLAPKRATDFWLTLSSSVPDRVCLDVPGDPQHLHRLPAVHHQHHRHHASPSPHRLLW